MTAGSFLQTHPPLKLNPIKPETIVKGGYAISYTGHVPQRVRLMLAVGDLSTAIDVSHRPPGNLLDPENLPKFLSCIGRRKLWGTKAATCSLYAVRGGDSVVAQSEPETFNPPVRPYVGRLGPWLGAPDSGPKLQYTGVKGGRTLHIAAIDAATITHMLVGLKPITACEDSIVSPMPAPSSGFPLTQTP